MPPRRISASSSWRVRRSNCCDAIIVVIDVK
jgi:hypothetical protein